MKHTISACYRNVRLRPVYEYDLEALRTWRNDVQFNQFLTKLDTITPEMQHKWFMRDNNDTDCYTFAIEETLSLKRIVGSVAIYNFNGTTAECGRFLIGDKETQGKGIGFIGMTLCLYLGFKKLALQEIFASVHEDNISAIKTDLKSGFAVYGKNLCSDGKHQLKIIAKRDYFFKLHNFLSEIKIKND